MSEQRNHAPRPQPGPSPPDIGPDQVERRPPDGRKTTGEREIPVREGEDLEHPDPKRDRDDPGRDDDVRTQKH
jgi:hypothetical protein